MNARTRIVAVGLAGTLLVAGCAADTNPNVIGAGESLSETMDADSNEALAKLQTSLDVVATELSRAEPDPDLVVAWAEIQARVSDAMVAVQTDPGFDRSGLESALDKFELDLEALDRDELASAWMEFRTSLSSFIQSFAG